MKRKPYLRTAVIRAKTSESMKAAWMRRRAQFPPEVRVNVTVKARDAKMFPKYGQTAAGAVSVLLAGAELLRWTFSPGKGWVPALPKCATCEGEEVLA